MADMPLRMMMKNLLFKRILIASDHRGFLLKQKITDHFSHVSKLDIQDMGPFSEAQADYPDYAQKLCHGLKEGDMGILICGTGIGMSISANRYLHVRAALCSNKDMAFKARSHNNANILVLGGDIIGYNEAITMIDAFQKTPFEGGRHAQRTDKINKGGFHV